ncbi:MAG TPA: hypothetical protein VEC18_09900 [Myxococcota bacterium]|nr:hypothetical protein [Myxococcota bacterium]
MIRADGSRGGLRSSGALIAALLALAVLATSCETRKTRMDSWHGRPIEELIESWGAPSGIVSLKDGRKVYTWIAVYGSGRTYRSTFTTSKDGIIESSAYHDASVPGKAE